MAYYVALTATVYVLDRGSGWRTEVHALHYWYHFVVYDMRIRRDAHLFLPLLQQWAAHCWEVRRLGLSV